MRGLAELRDRNERPGGEAGPFPNLHTRVAIRSACEEILRTTAVWLDRAAADQFAFGFVRGVLHQLASDGSPATADFARALLEQVHVGGAAAVKKILYSVTGD